MKVNWQTTQKLDSEIKFAFRVEGLFIKCNNYNSFIVVYKNETQFGVYFVLPLIPPEKNERPIVTNFVSNQTTSKKLCLQSAGWKHLVSGGGKFSFC